MQCWAMNMCSVCLQSVATMLIHIVQARTPLLSATLNQGVGRGSWILIQEFGVTIPFHNWPEKNPQPNKQFQCCKRINGAKIRSHFTERIIWIEFDKMKFYSWKIMIGNMCEIKKRINQSNKKGNPGIRTHAIVFPRYTLSPVGHGGALFQCEENPFDISLLILCDIKWPNVNKS